MPRWGMVIDLRKCLGCDSCVTACGEANKVPRSNWRRVIDCGTSENTDRQRVLVTLSCQHCAEAPCHKVCPTGATVHRPDGIIQVDYEKCIGCGYCIVACPYRARTILADGFEFEIGEGPRPETGNSPSILAGVCSKCNFCLGRIEEGLSRGLKPGEDPEATPVCVISCSAGALHFGDLDDPLSEVSRLLAENHAVRLREDLCTNPAVAYIVPPEWIDPSDSLDSKEGHDGTA